MEEIVWPTEPSVCAAESTHVCTSCISHSPRQPWLIGWHSELRVQERTCTQAYTCWSAYQMLTDSLLNTFTENYRNFVVSNLLCKWIDVENFSGSKRPALRLMPLVKYVYTIPSSPSFVFTNNIVWTISNWFSCLCNQYFRGSIEGISKH